jgi:predicted transposase YbfD/YdcC
MQFLLVNKQNKNIANYLSISKDAAVVSGHAVLNHWQASNTEKHVLPAQKSSVIIHSRRNRTKA